MIKFTDINKKIVSEICFENIDLEIDSFEYSYALPEGTANSSLYNGAGQVAQTSYPLAVSLPSHHRFPPVRRRL